MTRENFLKDDINLNKEGSHLFIINIADLNNLF